MDTGRTFIEVPTFTKKWHALDLTDDERKAFKAVIKILKEE